MEKEPVVQKPVHKVLNTTAIIICLILIPLIIANLTIIVRSFIYPDKVPSFMGFKPFIVLSDSMKPSISSGNLVLVKEIEADKLKEGDVISFREGTAVITHRIIRITDNDGQRTFNTRGDNNTSDDPLGVKEEMLEGIYLFGVPTLGNAALFIQTPLGMVLVIALPLILFIFFDIMRRRRVDREKQLKTMELEQELERMRRQVSYNETSESTAACSLEES